MNLTEQQLRAEGFKSGWNQGRRETAERILKEINIFTKLGDDMLIPKNISFFKAKIKEIGGLKL